MNAPGRASWPSTMRVGGIIRLRNLVLLAGVVLLAGWFVLLRPAFLGGPATYIWVTGVSMEPTLRSGDLIVARVQSTYGKGDVVAFRPPQHRTSGDAVVVHRIVGGSADEAFITRGDNNEAGDPWRISEGDILGEMWFSAPGAGRILAVLRAPLLLAGLAASVAVFLVLSGGEEKKRPRQPSPTEPPHSIHRPRPRGLGQGLLLILTTGARMALRFTARHQRGGRHP